MMDLLAFDQRLCVSAPVKQEIEYYGSDGKQYKAYVYVKQYGLSRARAVIAAFAARKDDDTASDDEIASVIAEHIVGEDGKPIFTVEQAQQLNYSLGLSLMAAIGRANDPNQQTSEQTDKQSAMTSD